ncbi:unnamed protein product [Didymodactylos carnosus]|uniref:RRM domain-containing protein n=1 Tax=Didymodactylos carnosus TaxID=1234261 RepID=A0A813X939_9BILA|nr:unnamed protein product [Didymodactylos carnosus]CAF0861527.1 unnamed protein product [Didymodactylos carnosus]CAF3554632.1 unnamed protein product [Didymodactylos carnosus]CAF3649190.1 unnamed protein product [Didymodactylos carnosus]
MNQNHSQQQQQHHQQYQSQYNQQLWGMNNNNSGDPYHPQGQQYPSYYDQAMYGGQYDQLAAAMYAQQQPQQILGDGTIPQESPKGGYVVYVYGIGQRATQEELLMLFQQYGRVLRVDIIIDFNTGLGKGFAFVAMERYQDAQVAIQSLDRMPYHGKQLQVRFKAN